MFLKIVDNWYENPDEIRNLALDSFKLDSVNGNSDKNGKFPGFYPGFRTRATIDNAVLNLKKLQSHLNNRIDERKWINNSSVVCDDHDLWEFDLLTMKPRLKEHKLYVDLHSKSSNCSFQYIPEDSKAWIHSDHGNEYAAVVYLHPNPPPGCGTSFYKRKKTGRTYYDKTIEEQGTLEEAEHEHLYGDESLNFDNWEEVNYVENVYNRCIIYEGKYFHTARDYFGTTPEDSRLTQVFFFNLINPNFVFEYRPS